MSFEVEEMPVSDRCREILEKREHALIGVSPFNSYYSEENIEKLICWALYHFKNFHLAIPDELPCYNLEAIGYTAEKAKKKTKKQINRLLNIISRVFDKHLLPEKERKNKILLISQLYNNPAYEDLYDKCKQKYITNEQFKQKCHKSASTVLKNYTIDITELMLDLASEYILKELPLYLNTPRLLNLNSSIVIYHEYIDFFAEMYQNREENCISQNQGHAIMRFKNG